MYLTSQITQLTADGVAVTASILEEVAMLDVQPAEVILLELVNLKRIKELC